jgi:hypothetical protein
MEQVKKILDLLVSGTIILAFVAAIPSVLLYISALTYDNAYLDYWGIPHTLFFKSSDLINIAELTVSGYATKSLIHTIYIVILLLGVFGLVVAFFPMAKRYLQRKCSAEKKMLQIRKVVFFLYVWFSFL